jgi:hypothetical protein
MLQKNYEKIEKFIGAIWFLPRLCPRGLTVVESNGGEGELKPLLMKERWGLVTVGMSLVFTPAFCFSLSSELPQWVNILKCTQVSSKTSVTDWLILQDSPFGRT